MTRCIHLIGFKTVNNYDYNANQGRFYSTASSWCWNSIKKSSIQHTCRQWKVASLLLYDSNEWLKREFSVKFRWDNCHFGWRGQCFWRKNVESKEYFNWNFEGIKMLCIFFMFHVSFLLSFSLSFFVHKKLVVLKEVVLYTDNHIKA